MGWSAIGWMDDFIFLRICHQIGDRLCHHGYLGDIVTGPFLAYCLDCEDKDMLRLTNGVHSKRTADIAERNVFRMMHELLYGRSFVASRSGFVPCHA
jgi:dynein assembly factor 3